MRSSSAATRFDGGSYLDWKIDVDDNVIDDGVYVKTGILFRGFGPLPGNLARLSVSSNTIGVPADVAPELANAIQFGPAYGPGTIERNNIKSSGGTGILVLGGGVESDMEMTIGHNDVEGASISILVDDRVPRSQITSNYLVGDSGADIGICQGNVNKTKPNKFVNISADLRIVTDPDDDSVQCVDLATPAPWVE